MSVSGLALILFLTFHASMNLVALFSAEGYNMICAFLGANWYAVAATAALGGLTVIHILYAFWLTVQNRKARGVSRYDVTDKPAQVEWASQNMLALGIVILLGMGLHLFNFWANMMLPELIYGHDAVAMAAAEGIPSPTDGYAWIAFTFSCPVYVALYVIWLAALWFHLTHGFWSALHTMGWNGKVWFKRWQVIGNVYSTVLILMFLVVVLKFALCGACC